MKECANIKNTCWSMQEKKLTIEDIRKEINKKQDSFFIDAIGGVINNDDYLDDNFFHSENEIKQMIAIQKIRTAAYYLNNYKHIFIIQDKNYYNFLYKNMKIIIQEFSLRDVSIAKTIKYIFESKEHAEKCLEILGEKVIKESLGIFEE